MELRIVKLDGQVADDTLLVADAFKREFNEALVHQVLVAYLASGRAGTRAQKNRSQVSGGGSKPWRQKGTGRARAGTNRSPLWRGGGVTFAARPQSFVQKVNKKMYRAALLSIFTELLRQDRLIILDELALAEPKTKTILALLNTLEINDNSVLMVVEKVDENLYLSSRNLPNVDVRDVISINPNCLISFDKVVIAKSAFKKIEEWLV